MDERYEEEFCMPEPELNYYKEPFIVSIKWTLKDTFRLAVKPIYSGFAIYFGVWIASKIFGKIF